MRFLIALALLIPTAAFAQQTQPIMITPQEYQAAVSSLIARDPLLQMFVTKQDEQQRVAKAKAEAATPEPKAP